MKYNHLLYTAALVVSCFSTNSLRADADFKAKTYQSPKGQSLNYRIHLPPKSNTIKKHPLVLLFHGAGERGNDNDKQLTHGAQDVLAYTKKNHSNAIIVAPQCPSGEKWVNTPWGADAHTMPKEPSAAMLLTLALLQDLQASHSIDTSRIYVTGLSMGGFGTWDIIQRMPDTFAAAMPVCGGGDTDMANAIKHVPIWAFHGGADKVVKVKRSQDMVAALLNVGGNIKYTEYKGVGHNSWGRTYADEKALKWLFAQKKNPSE
ncbi:MAG: prolyl oligopeptidase family serine peptidase [Verrucomicrobiae bacterium]|nr:prolyl oligopeptidase family serine peptidase [Verrucomicrobiae bacterium]NNJ43313.1 prolyl oligopeptidase family serine peptidase [Akkermansiaceae bacterium]